MQIRGKTILKIARIQNQLQLIGFIIPQTSFKTQSILLNYGSQPGVRQSGVNLRPKLAKTHD